MPTVVAPVEAYNIRTAAKSSGLSPSTIKRALDAGDLAELPRPTINGTPARVRLIDPAELRRWLGTRHE